MDPLPFRIFNVAVHAGVCVLLLRLLRELGFTLPVAFGVAAVFAVHPSHAEPVLWIASRTDLVATFFALLSLVCYARGRVGWSVAAFFVGLLAKESVVVVPLIVAAFGVLWRPPLRWGQLGGFGLAFLAYLGLRLALVGPALDNGLARSGGVKLMGTTAIQVVRTILPGLPMGDSALNNSEAIASVAGWAMLAVGLLILGSAGASPASGAQAPEALGNRPVGDSTLGRMPPSQEASVLLAAFVISLLPAIGLAVRLFRAQGERFLYLPSVFLLAWVLIRLFGKKPQRMVWVAAACFGLLQVQSFFWREGAEVSKRVDVAVGRDVVPRLSPATKRIVLLNPPVRVQGSYGAFYVLGEIARNHGANPALEVELPTALQLYRASHSVRRDGVTFSIRPEDGVFLPEETLGTQSPTSEQLRAKGLERLTKSTAVFLPRADIPTFWWDGERFHPIAN